MQSGMEGGRQMESQRRPVGRDMPPRAAEEGRLMIDRAERQWQQQVAKEEVPVHTAPGAALRWLALGGRARCHRFSDVRTTRPHRLS